MKFIPVLMYHSLEGGVPPDSKSTTITLESFREQMAFLHDSGYKTVTLKQFFEGKGKAEKQCLITFDDGFYSTLHLAHPIMQAYAFKGVLFLPTGPVGKDSFKDINGFGGIKADRPMTWDEVKLLHQNGWSIQPHSLHHHRMSDLTEDSIAEEVSLSRKIIMELTGEEADYFAYPFGDYDRRVIQQLKKAGYKAAFTVHPGLTSTSGNFFRLRRIEINSQDTLASFQHKLLTGYTSSTDKIRSQVRDLVYANLYVKDTIQKLIR